jgi:hypothetical protein
MTLMQLDFTYFPLLPWLHSLLLARCFIASLPKAKKRKAKACREAGISGRMKHSKLSF